MPPFELVDGTYAHIPAGGGSTSHLVPGAGRIVFEISCSSQFEIQFEAAVMAPNPQDDSFYVQFDNETFDWHIDLTEDTFEWREVKETEEKHKWSTVADVGDHTLTFHEREDGTAIKSVRFLTGNPECAFKAPCVGTKFFII